MNNVQIKELNLLLLNFAGFKRGTNGSFVTGLWKYPNDKVRQIAPNLVTSLDAQSKWLYPKLKIITKTNGYKGWVVTLNIGVGKIPCYLGEDNDEATAFALAVKDLLNYNPELIKG